VNYKMIELKIRFTAQLKDRAGLATDSIKIDANNKLQDLLKLLIEKYGESFGKILFDTDGSYRNSNLIVINQYQVNYNENTQLNDGDEIALMSPISGG